MTQYGVPQYELATFIGIDDKTLRAYYREELDKGKIGAHERVGKFLFNAASGDALQDGATYADCVRAAMFWAKTQMGFREVKALEHTSPDGSMSPAQPKDVDSKLVEALGKKLL